MQCWATFAAEESSALPSAALKEVECSRPSQMPMHSNFTGCGKLCVPSHHTCNCVRSVPSAHVQVRVITEVVKAIEGASAKPSDLCWPTALYATGNFWHSVEGTAYGVPATVPAEFMRHARFLLACLDGSVLLVSEREAHHIAQAFHDAARNGGTRQDSSALLHASFAHVGLPHEPSRSCCKRQCRCVAAGVPLAHHMCCAGASAPARSRVALPAAPARTMALCAAAASLFNGACSFSYLAGSEAAASVAALESQDAQRMNLVRAVVLGGAETALDVEARTQAVRTLLALRRRRKHYHGSDLSSICERGLDQARARALVADAAPAGAGAP